MIFSEYSNLYNCFCLEGNISEDHLILSHFPVLVCAPETYADVCIILRQQWGPMSSTFVSLDCSAHRKIVKLQNECDMTSFEIEF